MAFKKASFKKAYQKISTPEKKLLLMGGEIVVDIINRTQNGKDKNNKTFKKYSPRYAKTKAKLSSKVNLTVKGNMLNAISYKKISNGLRFYIIGNEEKKKSLANIKLGRKFFGIDPQQKKEIKKRLENG